MRYDNYIASTRFTEYAICPIIQGVYLLEFGFRMVNLITMCYIFGRLRLFNVHGVVCLLLAPLPWIVNSFALCFGL
jgi:hypothetical protein